MYCHLNLTRNVLRSSNEINMKILKFTLNWIVCIILCIVYQIFFHRKFWLVFFRNKIYNDINKWVLFIEIVVLLSVSWICFSTLNKYTMKRTELFGLRFWQFCTNFMYKSMMGSENYKKNTLRWWTVLFTEQKWKDKWNV